ncbi:MULTISPECIES: histidine--tRNA ligase [unclassified Polaribacter]|uniref:histidine--tRNA ligase n=1 Tax=unclassified Polaribacter TaxID=196858 RepID=UPI00052C9651|nr:MULTISPECIES: histidine--tRNA ligase [unclassified Polaribacter]KGL60723.1 histidyl-tRNA synthetase [Polaribacter sp. Hel1_33_49]PKV64986.1 histidyl-tRNA synthetase [Polaribacter sp. Hel1_33_96]
MKPSIPKGTRDFSPTEVANRSYIMNTIKTAFEVFGFQPIETPSFENSSTLMGKYGEEGDRLIFKILNSGDFLAKADKKLLEEKNSLKLTSQISEKALRYDLTVPFARYVVQHQNEITFPFKRYQVQPVWRADRPQKGRFREFFQCDADVVGSKSLWQEVEFIQLYDTVFTKLGLEGTTIKMNNRKILSGIAEVIGAQDKLIDFTVALDKLDKIGREGVVKELLAKGITEEAIGKLTPLFDFSGSNVDKLASLENMLQTSVEGSSGVEELRFVINAIDELGLESSTLAIDVTLARGLNYYTGAIFEVAAPETVKMGSIGGGGRYDDLTGIFGLKDVSGVGISFGLDRIYLVLEELSLFKEVALPKPKVIFLNFDSATDAVKMKAIKSLREHAIKSEFYPDLGESNKQQKRQWKYITNREIEFVVSKVENDVFTLKNMNSAKQINCSLSEMINMLKA